MRDSCVNDHQTAWFIKLTLAKLAIHCNKRGSSLMRYCITTQYGVTNEFEYLVSRQEIMFSNASGSPDIINILSYKDASQ